MYSFVSPGIDALEGAIRAIMARRNRKGIPNLEDIIPNDDYTIIVAAYNEASRESSTPGKSRLEKHLEILDGWKSKLILVDDGSTDNTAEVARAAGYNVFRCEENGFKAGSILKALKSLTNEYVIVVDLDTYPDPEQGSLEALSRAVGWVQAQNIGGACVTLLPFIRQRPVLDWSSPSGFIRSLRERGSYYLEVIQNAEYILAMRSTRGSQNSPGRQRVMTISGGFGIYRREAYIQSCSRFVEFPNRRFSMEDVFNTTTIKNLGLRTAYFPNLIIRTEVPCDVVALMDQRDKWEIAVIRNTIHFLPDLIKESGRREEALWIVLNTIILRPIKYVSTGPLIAYGLIHPTFLIGYFFLYTAIISIIMKANTSRREFSQISEVLLLIPLYSFLLNTFVYTKAWAAECTYYLKVWVKRLIHPSSRSRLQVWLDNDNVFLKSDSVTALNYSTYQGLVNILSEAEPTLPDYVFAVKLIDNPSDDELDRLDGYGKAGVARMFKTRYKEVSQAFAVSFTNRNTGEQIPLALGLTNHTAAVVSSVYPEYLDNVYEHLSRRRDVTLNFEEFSPQFDQIPDGS